MAECEGPESKTMKIILLGDLPLYSSFISVEFKCICSIGKFTPGSFKKYNLFLVLNSFFGFPSRWPREHLEENGGCVSRTSRGHLEDIGSGGRWVPGANDHQGNYIFIITSNIYILKKISFSRKKKLSLQI